MKRSEIANLGDLVGIRVQPEEIQELKDNAAFQRQEQGIFDLLDALYNKIAIGGISMLDTENIRGQILALRFILSLPDMISTEADGYKLHPTEVTQADQEEIDEFIDRRYNKETSNE